MLYSMLKMDPFMGMLLRIRDSVETTRRELLNVPTVPSCLMSPSYIGALHTYLTSFMRRTQPLLDIDSKQAATVEEFNTLWDAGELDEGWIDESQKAPPDGSGEAIWCTACEYFKMM